MADEKKGALRLGLDIGTNSLGWALIDLRAGSQRRILAVGTRAFQEGLDELKKDGRGKSRNSQRREARQRRRQTERRSRRMTKLFHQLCRCSLFQLQPPTTSLDRHEYLTELDLRFGDPYQLRARALDERLDREALGRVFYHLAQRRGYLSNRREQGKDEKEAGVVKGGIDSLSSLIEESGSRTLGEFFARNIHQGERIRQRYTSRKMYEHEFDLIWAGQAAKSPELLKGELRDQLYRTIFFQRKLKSQSHLIGKCTLEPERRRAPWALLDVQRFRYLKTLNNLEIEDRETGEIRRLSESERASAIEKLEYDISTSFKSLRKHLKLGKLTAFNLERGGEEKMSGNSTAARITKITGIEFWVGLSEEDRNLLVNDIRCYEKTDALQRRLMSKWRLPADQAGLLAKLNFEDGYCAFSRQAISRLLPKLQSGLREAEAIKCEYPERFARSNAAVKVLPPVDTDLLPTMRNPIVVRALTELRRVVNGIIKRYGLPDEMHVEMGRDLRQSAEQRERAVTKMRINEKRRALAAERIKRETPIQNPSRSDIERLLLADECGWICPYTGNQFSMGELLGDNPQLDVEHIIPFERCLDDSFINKTLCRTDENRHEKRNRTPLEAYSSDGERWRSIMNRVRMFKSDLALEKLKRFRMTSAEVLELTQDFTERQLNDTRWASRWAKQYLGLLYGGANSDGIDEQGRRRVIATSGGATGFLRQEWGLNSILGDPSGLTKSRDDHRHHAIDAAVIALTDAGAIQSLSRSAASAASRGRRLLSKFDQPWDGFRQELASAVSCIVTSHRLSKRVRGPLHADTFYGRPYTIDGKGVTHIRVPLESLGLNDIDAIVDPVIRRAVKARLELLRLAPDKAFAVRENHPVIAQPNGTEYRVRHVRIIRTLETYQIIGKPPHERFVKNDTMSHMEIVETKNRRGAVEWQGVVVPLLEASRRRAAGQPIVNRSHGDGKTFQFSLAGGEIIQLGDLDNPGSNRKLYRIRTVPSSLQLYFVPVNDARPLSEIGRSGLTGYPETLRRRGCRKMVVTPLGEVRYARD